MNIRFCPQCASSQIVLENHHRLHCLQCDFVYYHNVAAAVAGILRYKDKILFTVRNQEPEKGTWDLPGGFIDPNENASQALCRELKEELGIDVPQNRLNYLTTFPNRYKYREVNYRTLDIFYEIRLEEKITTITSLDEIRSVLWIPWAEIEINRIGLFSIRAVMQQLMNKELKLK